VKIKEIHCGHWFLSDWIGAITLYPFIFYNMNHKQYKEDFLSLQYHEFVHVAQVRHLGWFKFYFSYAYETLRKGYKNNKYEIEAYEAENKFRMDRE